MKKVIKIKQKNKQKYKFLVLDLISLKVVLSSVSVKDTVIA